MNKKLRLIYSPTNDKNSELYAKSIKRIAKEQNVDIEEIHAKEQYDVTQAILHCALHGGKYLLLEPTEFHNNAMDSKFTNAEDFQTARVVSDDIITKYNSRLVRVLVIGKGKLVGRPVFEALSKEGFATCLMGSMALLDQDFIDAFDVFVYACPQNVEGFTHKLNSIIYDVAGINKQANDENVRYTSMRTIGTSTTNLMLKEI